MKKKCAFCDKSQFKERLVGEFPDFWVIVTFGQITNGGYLLLVPKRHVTCFGALEATEACVADTIQRDIAEAFRKEYGTKTIFFEHGICGQTIKHAHLHLLPAKLDITPTVIRHFYNAEFSFMFFGNLAQVQELFTQESKPYLLWKDARNPHIKAFWDPKNVPPQYFRIIVAQALGCPERADWRTMDPALDKQLGSETVKRMRPYF